MSSNEKILTKKEFKSGFIRSLMLSCDWNFERQMHVGFCFSMIPFIDKLYKNKQDRAEAYKRHMEFYNTHVTPSIYLRSGSSYGRRKCTESRI